MSVTSFRIFSSAESKLILLIGMTIFNDGLQFRILKKDTFRAMIRSDRKVSMYYKLSGRDTVRGPFLGNYF